VTSGTRQKGKALKKEQGKIILKKYQAIQYMMWHSRLKEIILEITYIIAPDPTPRNTLLEKGNV
jgi:hypothetical protein